ncbi:MAG: glycosyltransferase family 39 protein [Chloroflexota bacterium]|nr:glycosyltransferase family 39 protein [Chloroflexota bacterium]
MRRERLLLVIGLVFAFLGQFYFAYQREYVWDGVLFWCLAILAFSTLLWRVTRQERGRSGWRLIAWVSGRSARVLAAVGGAWLASLAGWLARRRPETADFSGFLWMWLLGVYWFLAAFMPSLAIKEWWPRLAHWLRNHRSEVAGLAALLLVALAVRAVDLEHIPANLGGDEGTWGMEGLAMLDGGRLSNPFATRWFGFPSMSFLAWGLSMRVFGESIAGLRALSALIGTSTVLTTFLLARELWGRRVAWLSAVILTFGHFHIHYSRLAVNNIADGLFMTLSLWLLVRGLRSKRPIHFALAGALVGLGWYGYFGARLIGVVVAFYLAWRAVVEYRFLARYGGLLLIMVAAALVVVAPLLFHYADHPDMLVSRSRQVSIFASGWLEREQVVTGRSAASLILQQFWKSVSAFNYTLDPTFWYHPTIPLLDFISGALFIPGLLWATARYRWPANGLLLLWFWLALLSGWVMTENPPSSMRLAGVSPALALLVSLGLNWLVELLEPLRITHRSSRRTLATVLLAAVVITNLYYYFAIYTPTRVYGNPSAEIATELGRHLMQQDDDSIVYFYAPPFMYWNFGSLAFMTRGIEGVDVPPPEAGGWSEPDLSQGARFVFLPERLGELDAVRARHPGGLETPVLSSADGRLLYVLYTVEK